MCTLAIFKRLLSVHYCTQIDFVYWKESLRGVVDKPLMLYQVVPSLIPR